MKGTAEERERERAKTRQSKVILKADSNKSSVGKKKQTMEIAANENRKRNLRKRLKKKNRDKLVN